MPTPPVPTPRVSVVIPTKNRSVLLRRAVDSVLAQTVADQIEVVVVDDGSDELVRTAMAHWLPPEVRVVRHDRSTGVSKARNDGVAAARGTWVAFLDDDDVWAPTKIERQLEAADAAGAGFVCTGTVAVDSKLHPRSMICPPDAAVLRAELFQHNAVGSPSSVMCLKSVALGAPFDDRFSIMADWDAWLRMTADVPLAVCPEPLVGYVFHDDNMHAADMAATMAEFEQLRALYARGPEDFDGHDWWVWIGATNRRLGRRGDAIRAYLRAFRRHPSAGYLARAGAAAVGIRGVIERPGVSAAPSVQWVHELSARADRLAALAGGIPLAA